MSSYLALQANSEFIWGAQQSVKAQKDHKSRAEQPEADNPLAHKNSLVTLNDKLIRFVKSFRYQIAQLKLMSLTLSTLHVRHTTNNDNNFIKSKQHKQISINSTLVIQSDSLEEKGLINSCE